MTLLRRQPGYSSYLHKVTYLLLLVCLIPFLSFGTPEAWGGTLSSVSPAGASSTVTIYITGTGFNTTASNNEVAFTHTSGVSAVATATAVATLDTATGLRRLTLKVPGGLFAGTTSLRVVNKVTGEASIGKSIEVIEISMPDVASAVPGTANLNVRITGSPNCKFVAGATRATFGTGSGITVNSTTVESATGLVANITVSATAVPGLRSAGVITTTQTAFRADVFTISYDTDNDNDGYKVSQGDCDDNNHLINPGMQESCNGIDDNCNNSVDENLGGATCTTGQTGICSQGIEQCVNGNLVCNRINQPSAETCDGLDNDCDGAADDGLGSTTCGVAICQHTIDNCINGVLQICNPMEGAGAEVCDGSDNDCDGVIDNGVLNACGYCGPVPFEVCDGIDNDCDGQIDEGVTLTFYRDADGDQYGYTTNSVNACTAPAGYVTNNLDCDDSNSNIYPGAVEIAGNGIDEDCSGVDTPLPQQPQISVNDYYEVDEGETLQFNVTASDPDGTAVTLSASPSIKNTTFRSINGVQATGSFGFAPDNTQQGNYYVTFTASDPLGYKDKKKVRILVNNINRAPAITVESPKEVDEGGALTLRVDVSDPDGDILSVTADPLPQNAIFVEATRTLTFTPDYTQAGEYDITFSVDDGSGPQAASGHIVVNDVPQGGTGGVLTLEVDPVESPTFAETQRITGRVNSEGEPVQPMKSVLISGLDPVNGAQGQTLNVRITGQSSGAYAAHFQNGLSQANFGEGITVNSINVLNPTEADVNITINGSAPTGARSVSITTGNEYAVSVIAFNVTQGKAGVSGILVDPETGQPIADATVIIQGTNISAITGQDGSFTLRDVPTGQQTLIINAQNHELITMPIDTQTGAVDIGEIESQATVFDPEAPASVSLGSLISRISIDQGDQRSMAELEETVIDAVKFVGGRDLGVIDEYGNELNPNVTETPFLRLKPSAVATIAMRTKVESSVTLGELLWQFTQLWRWQEKPNILDWLNGIQQAVNQAWANPNAPESRLFILLFNNGKTLSFQPPQIVPDYPLNAMQAALMKFSLFITGARAIDPDDVFSILPEDYFPLDEGTATGAAEFIQLAWLEVVTDAGQQMFDLPYTYNDSFLLAQAGGGQITAKAARSKENAYVGKKLLLDSQNSIIPHGMRVQVDWSVTSFEPSDPSNITPAQFQLETNTVVGMRKRIIYFLPQAPGNYTVQLVISSEDGTVVSEPYEISIVVRHWPCDPRGMDPEWEDEEVVNLDRPWQNVLCTMAADKTVDILQTELGSLVSEFGIPELPSSAYEEWKSSGTIAGDVTARLESEKNFMKFFQNKDVKYSATIRSYAQTYEKYLPDIMEAAKEESPTVYKEIKGMVVKELLTGALGYFKDEADKLGESIMYAWLDNVIDKLIEGLKPAPPMIHHIDVLDASHDPNRKVAIIFFDRSPSEPTPEEKAAGEKSNQHFYYRLWREVHGNIESIALGPEGDDIMGGPVPSLDENYKNLLLFIDPAPPEGQVRYYIQTRRIIGEKTVPSITMWNEAEFFLTNYVIGGVCPPAAAQYNFSKGIMERFLKILKEIKLQDSDLSVPEIVYVPRPFERPTPPVSIAADSTKRIFVSVPVTSSVFTLKGGNLEYAFDAGFKDPYQVGLAADDLGYLYSVNSASEAQFGGRIFRWKPISYEREFFGSVQYYSRLLGYAKPSAAQSMYAGMLKGRERLFLTDLYAGTLNALDIPAGGALPPGDLFHNVSQPIAARPDMEPTAQSSMTISRAFDLFMTQGDNIFRYGDAGSYGMLFESNKPFQMMSGIDADIFGNLYVADSFAGTITALPYDFLNDTFFQRLTEDPAARSLYTLVSGIESPGEMRIGSRGSALIWFDRKGLNSRQFGLSGRVIEQSTGQPVAYAGVSCETFGKTFEVSTDEYGVFHMPGLLSPIAAPPSVALLIRDRLGRSMTFRVNSLQREGETFIDPVLFIPDVIPLPRSYVPNPPPAPPVPALIEVDLTGGSSVFMTTDIDPGGLPPVPPPDIQPPPGVSLSFAPKIELVSPVDGLETNSTHIDIVGVVSDQSITEARLIVNGVEQTVPVVNRRFDASINLINGINSIEAMASVVSNGQTMTGTSGVTYVQLVNVPTGKNGLSGVVLDTNTGYPVQNVRVIIRNSGFYTYTDSLGVWFISDIPNGAYDIEILP